MQNDCHGGDGVAVVTGSPPPPPPSSPSTSSHLAPSTHNSMDLGRSWQPLHILTQWAWSMSDHSVHTSHEACQINAASQTILIQWLCSFFDHYDTVVMQLVRLFWRSGHAACKTILTQWPCSLSDHSDTVVMKSVRQFCHSGHVRPFWHGGQEACQTNETYQIIRTQRKWSMSNRWSLSDHYDTDAIKSVRPLWHRGHKASHRPTKHQTIPTKRQWSFHRPIKLVRPFWHSVHEACQTNE